MNSEVVVASVAAPVVVAILVIVFGDPLRAVRDWCWRRMFVSVGWCCSRYQDWHRKRCRKRVEASLDKVRELVGRKDFWSAKVWDWPEELKRLWFEAAAQIIESEVNWDVVVPGHGVTVSLRDNRRRMRLDRGDIHFESDPNLKRFAGGTSPGAGS